MIDIPETSEAVTRLDGLVRELLGKNRKAEESLRNAMDQLRKACLQEQRATAGWETAEQRVEELSALHQLEISALNSAHIQEVFQTGARSEDELNDLRAQLATFADRARLTADRDLDLTARVSRLVDETASQSGVVSQQAARVADRLDEVDPLDEHLIGSGSIRIRHQGDETGSLSSGVVLVDGDAVAAAAWSDRDLADARTELLAALVRFAPASPHNIDVVFGAMPGAQANMGAPDGLRVRVLGPSVRLETAVTALMKTYLDNPVVVVSDQIESARCVSPGRFSSALRSSYSCAMGAVLEDQLR